MFVDQRDNLRSVAFDLETEGRRCQTHGPILNPIASSIVAVGVLLACLRTLKHPDKQSASVGGRHEPVDSRKAADRERVGAPQYRYFVLI